MFAGERLLVATDAETFAIPLGHDWPFPELAPVRRLYMGEHAGQSCYALEIADSAALPTGLTIKGLRELWGRLDDALIGLAGQAIQLIEWDRTHRFCGRCATPMTLRTNERAKHCPACGLSSYPRIAPAVMVRIVRDGEILLARSPRFPPGRYSVLAGFVDPGESLEQTVHREVMEEVGLTVTHLRYIASQSWPFPHSLMIAFGADYAGGEITIDGEEIEDAGWYRPDNLPDLPTTMSISRFLIDDYLRQTR
ncbi:MAG: NAD(+) diphosphatase [Gammaproteobacteria bacterium]